MADRRFRHRFRSRAHHAAAPLLLAADPAEWLGGNKSSKFVAVVGSSSRDRVAVARDLLRRHLVNDKLSLSGCVVFTNCANWRGPESTVAAWLQERDERCSALKVLTLFDTGVVDEIIGEQQLEPCNTRRRAVVVVDMCNLTAEHWQSGALQRLVLNHQVLNIDVIACVTTLETVSASTRASIDFAFFLASAKQSNLWPCFSSTFNEPPLSPVATFNRALAIADAKAAASCSCVAAVVLDNCSVLSGHRRRCDSRVSWYSVPAPLQDFDTSKLICSSLQPPCVTTVIGSMKCGKTTLMQSLVKQAAGTCANVVVFSNSLNASASEPSSWPPSTVFVDGFKEHVVCRLLAEQKKALFCFAARCTAPGCCV